jgi:acetoin utilization deacetylase AcuC-like enzyme
MTTLLLTHPACLQHRGRPDSPEKPERLAAVLDRLDAPEFSSLVRRTAPRAERAQLCQVHDIGYVSKVYALAPEEGEAALSPDTSLNPSSLEAALRAAGAVCAAVDAVMAGEAHNAFCAVRPPGHHASANTTMGFCVFNNVAVGAAHARAALGLKRVAILDFDVHHGNGTQAIFRAEPGVLFASVHQTFIFPRTGDASETGVGNVINVPVVRDQGIDAVMAALNNGILPAIRAFRPELLLLSAGFDAHYSDPLADLRLKTSDFITVTETILKVADEVCGGRVVSTLEGGYDPRSLADCCAVHLRALMDFGGRAARPSVLNALAS